MMEKKDLIEKETEKTLQVLDGVNKAGLNPFLYSKIVNRMEEGVTVEKKFNIKLALGIVIVCIIVNFAAFLFIPKYSDSEYYTKEYKIKSFASEYSSINEFYFY